MEKLFRPVSGFLALLLALITLVVAIVLMANGVENDEPTWMMWVGVVVLLLAIFLFKGVTIINPNHSRVCVFFGKYVGTVKENGLKFINPLFRRINISLRA